MDSYRVNCANKFEFVWNFAPRTAEHQALLHDVLRGLKDPDVPIEPLFADELWESAVLRRNRAGW